MNTPFRPQTSFPVLRSCLTANLLAVSALLSACGGGGGDPGIGSAATPVASTPTPTADRVPTETYADLHNLCAKPRSGRAPDGTAYTDRQGTLLDEMKFLRRWTDDEYLWANEIPSTIRMADYTSAIDYFNVLKTPALTAAGKPKDRFHFTYPTVEWDALNNEGKETGYGIVWSTGSATVPRSWRVGTVEPGSPAANAGLMRGDTLLTVDTVDFVNATGTAALDQINAGLYPEGSQSHHFQVRRNGATLDVQMTPTEVAADPVKNAKVIPTADGKVGYLTFYDHNAVSEKRLIDSFTMFKNEGVKDLVLDLRYNGGGLLGIAAELGSMIAGPRVAGQTFERLVTNGKSAAEPPVAFPTTAYGYPTTTPVQQGQALPTLGLTRVTILTTDRTCSASESVINGLRGMDVQVNVIGGQTCGKPYGFYAAENCGTTYFSINFMGVNAKGFGDYPDGLAPTCAVNDDLGHALGDPAEGLLAAALAYRSTNACPAATLTGVPARAMKQVAPGSAQFAIYPKSRPGTVVR